MARLPHGAVIRMEAVREAQEALVGPAAASLAFAASRPIDPHNFDFLFPGLQNNPDNLLPVARRTRDNLIRLGQSMRDTSGGDPAGDSDIPAAYTYLGQFIDHDITLETVSATLPELLDPQLKPLPPGQIKNKIRNLRTAGLDLDSLYGLPAPRQDIKMVVGNVSPTGGTQIPLRRPPGKTDDNDLPRERRSPDIEHDRAALIGDPRNDENTIVAQLHTAFLLAHNVLAGRFQSFMQARRVLRQHYQHMVIQDFLKRVCDPRIVNETVRENHVYDAMAEPFFLPLEFSVAAYRFGHTMVRGAYNFNLNFNTSGAPGTVPATLGLLFTFTALSGQLGGGVVTAQGFDTLPENWIVEWENLVDAGRPFDRTRRLDTKLVEPLFELTDTLGNIIGSDALPPDPNALNGARLAVRNLLRGYLLRMPTGQAVARALKRKLQGVRDIPVLTPAQIVAGAASPEQENALRESGFDGRTPLWYYILAEAAILGRGQRLGPVGSTIVAEVIVGLVRRSEDSILRERGWRPTLPSARRGTFELADLLRLAQRLQSRPSPSGAKKKAGATKKSGAAKSSGAARKR
ncbi:MAG TPA: heme peroxidase family protein [Pyrinomonadaceae bacterium]